MQPGDLVAERFEIEALAGEGGMGAVYRARDRTTGGTVAVKVLHDTRVKQSVRFAREARLLEELEHPAIVRYVADGATTLGRAYLAMEWLEGESLADRLEGKHLAIVDAVDIARRVAGALAFAHERGVIHRDLKPSNLFLVDRRIDGVRVIDFGIARLPGQTVTETGAMLGTVGYMAPEQARGDAGVDARADVFSLGAVMFRCLTGRAAFEGADTLEVLLRLAEDEAPRLRERRPGVPATLDDLVARMLSRDPELRPRDGAAVLAELAAIEPTIREAASQGTLDDTLVEVPSAPRPKRGASPKTEDASVGPVAKTESDSRGRTTVSSARGRSTFYAALAAAMIVAISLAVIVWVRTRGAAAPGSSAAPAGSAKEYCPATRCEPVGLPDPEAVDVRDFVLRVQRTAREIEPEAKLMAASTQTLRRGVVNLRQGTITLAFFYPVTNGPEGGSFGYLTVTTDGLRVLFIRGGTSAAAPGEELPEPRCSSRDMWAAGRAKGLPDVAAPLSYSNTPTPTWFLSLPGPEHNYMFAEPTCELSQLGGASSEPTIEADAPTRYDVRVKNDGPRRVTQVVLEYQGGQRPIPVIEAGKALDVSLERAPMAIVFVDGSGRKVRDENVKLVSPRLELVIAADGSVLWNFPIGATAR